MILENVIDFKNTPSDEIPGIKLKIIISYLFNVYLIRNIFEDNSVQKDIVGEGIDFTFRLEKFANSSCILLNKYFFKSFKEKIELFEKTENFSYDILKLEKKIRSWEKEKFYCLTNKKMIEDAFKNSNSSINENSIAIDLFSKYISYTEKPNSQPNPPTTTKLSQ